MKSISWSEIKDRAYKFQNEWKDASNERSQAQSFWIAFFNVFGKEIKRLGGVFEKDIKSLQGTTNFIDLFWKGKILIEHKSKDKDLSKAYEQAQDYLHGLSDKELPKYILVCDFHQFIMYDTEVGNEPIANFTLGELVNNVQHFGFIAGYEKTYYKDTDEVNIQAAELMGKLYDALRSSKYDGHNLEIFMVRLLFCFFADDTGIFEKSLFHGLIKEQSSEDGNDLGGLISSVFELLNTQENKRQTTVDETRNKLPYVNGGLFEGHIPIPAFNSKMRESLIVCCEFDWSGISPAIFGSLFQSVSDDEKRRNLGEHYTSEKNIRKTIDNLFLNELKNEYNKIKNNKPKLKDFHNKLKSLRFFDPACGSGNFLILAYQELRRLETELIITLYNPLGMDRTLTTDIYSKVDVDQFYGIEINEFPSKIAETAMWMIDHKMNGELSEKIGQNYMRIPLKKSPTIVHGNSLRTDWNTILPAKECSYILGNPPFLGARIMSKEQKEEITDIFDGVKNNGNLDYVSAWYMKSAQYIQHNKTIKVALVSTNSITQGEQVGILWKSLMADYNIKIHFAHRTFSWANEARGNAAVHCVIIGFGAFDVSDKYLFDYADIKGEPTEVKVKNINPYLLEAKDIVVERRKKSLVDGIPKMAIGSMPIDNKNYIFDETEMNEFIKLEPKSKPLFHRYMGADELIQGNKRWILLLQKVKPEELQAMPHVLKRIDNVRKFRAKSTRGATRKMAAMPTRFDTENFPKKSYLGVPETSSENRKYIPIAFLLPEVIASNRLKVIENATFYHFGVLTSEMHMCWMKYTTGRLKSDYSYSIDIVYNNFPWAKNVTPAQAKKVEEKAQAVLDARAKHTDSTLADLYDPLTMPSDLLKAHQALDKAVDACYSEKKKFDTERDRMEFLFELYDHYVNPLID